MSGKADKAIDRRMAMIRPARAQSVLRETRHTPERTEAGEYLVALLVLIFEENTPPGELMSDWFTAAGDAARELVRAYRRARSDAGRERATEAFCGAMRVLFGEIKP